MGHSLSSMNFMRCGISATAQIDDEPAGQQPVVRRFLKIGNPLKTSHPGSHLAELCFLSYPFDKII
ncbi:hypothetical protein E2C01_038435 [Portunus trituberculatus]|uniref:Uncharacterized protein n=1 Tax=Portunus trituberculatus TaxID=210409 RepID=A0A5B7FGS0_PORTR|nr:hypothetical protein [Portunus trituberculatus]